MPTLRVSWPQPPSGLLTYFHTTCPTYTCFMAGCGLSKRCLEALESYIELLSNARCDRRHTNTWQHRATRECAEGLMELMATYRSSTPRPSPPPQIEF